MTRNWMLVRSGHCWAPGAPGAFGAIQVNMPAASCDGVRTGELTCAFVGQASGALMCLCPNTVRASRVAGRGACVSSKRDAVVSCYVRCRVILAAHDGVAACLDCNGLR